MTERFFFRMQFGLDPGHTRIRDHDWQVSHGRSPSVGRQKGWATLSDGPEDEVWDAKAFGHDKVLEHPGDDPVYESVSFPFPTQNHEGERVCS